MPTHNRKNPADKNLGMRIELARRREGLTQDELAAKIGRATGSVISQWEHARGEPQRDKMVPLAKALGVGVSWLSGEDVPDELREFEAKYLELLLAGGEALDELLQRFDSVEALMGHLRKYQPDPE